MHLLGSDQAEIEGYSSEEADMVGIRYQSVVVPAGWVQVWMAEAVGIAVGGRRAEEHAVQHKVLGAKS